MNNENDVVNPFGPIVGDAFAGAVSSIKPYSFQQNLAKTFGEEELAKQIASKSLKARMTLAGSYIPGSIVYGNKLGHSKSYYDALDAILGMTLGGTLGAGTSAALVTPTAQKLNDWADVWNNGSKTVEY